MDFSVPILIARDGEVLTRKDSLRNDHELMAPVSSPAALLALLAQVLF